MFLRGAAVGVRHEDGGHVLAADAGRPPCFAVTMVGRWGVEASRMQAPALVAVHRHLSSCGQKPRLISFITDASASGLHRPQRFSTPSAGRTGRSSPETSSIPTLRKPLPSRCQGWPRQSACRAVLTRSPASRGSARLGTAGSRRSCAAAGARVHPLAASPVPKRRRDMPGAVRCRPGAGG